MCKKKPRQAASSSSVDDISRNKKCRDFSTPHSLHEGHCGRPSEPAGALPPLSLRCTTSDFARSPSEPAMPANELPLLGVSERLCKPTRRGAGRA